MSCHRESVKRNLLCPKDIGKNWKIGVILILTSSLIVVRGSPGCCCQPSSLHHSEMRTSWNYTLSVWLDPIWQLTPEASINIIMDPDGVMTVFFFFFFTSTVCQCGYICSFCSLTRSLIYGSNHRDEPAEIWDPDFLPRPPVTSTYFLIAHNSSLQPSPRIRGTGERFLTRVSFETQN